MIKVHLVDGTYELFRCFYGAPSSKKNGREVGATRALVRSLASWLKSGEVTHLACAFDTVIESFRNEWFDGYKTGEGIDPALFSQFEWAERATRALGIVTWSMIEFEADDAIATAARRFAKEKRVERVFVCTPDKDLTQCVDDKIWSYDRWKKTSMDAQGVREKFGVGPKSIPDLLALVGDTADGIPGVDRWGMKSASTVLAEYESIEKIPDDSAEWTVKVRGAETLAATLAASRKEAALYKRLATLRYDVPLKETPDDLEWKGPDRKALDVLCAELGISGVLTTS